MGKRYSLIKPMKKFEPKYKDGTICKLSHDRGFDGTFWLILKFNEIISYNEGIICYSCLRCDAKDVRITIAENMLTPLL